MKRHMLTLLSLFALTAVVSAQTGSQGASKWVFMGADGRLH